MGRRSARPGPVPAAAGRHRLFRRADRTRPRRSGVPPRPRDRRRPGPLPRRLPGPVRRYRPRASVGVRGVPAAGRGRRRPAGRRLRPAVRHRHRRLAAAAGRDGRRRRRPDGRGELPGTGRHDPRPAARRRPRPRLVRPGLFGRTNGPGRAAGGGQTFDPVRRGRAGDDGPPPAHAHRPGLLDGDGRPVPGRRHAVPRGEHPGGRARGPARPDRVAGVGQGTGGDAGQLPQPDAPARGSRPRPGPGPRRRRDPRAVHPAGSGLVGRREAGRRPGPRPRPRRFAPRREAGERAAHRRRPADAPRLQPGRRRRPRRPARVRRHPGVHGPRAVPGPPRRPPDRRPGRPVFPGRRTL